MKRLFQSTSLVGRGTSAWLVTDGNQRRVMKTAWRSKSRLGEAEIYLRLQIKLDAAGKRWPKGVGRVQEGGDVAEKGSGFVRRGSTPLTISRIRRGAGEVLLEDPVLHRLVLTEVGRPLWEYETPSILLRGLRDAVAGACASPLLT